MMFRNAIPFYMEKSPEQSIEDKALAFIVDNYATCDTVNESDEALTTAQILDRLYHTFGQACTSYINVVNFMKAEGFTLSNYDSTVPRWLIKIK